MALNMYAGAKARAEIQEQGLSPHRISMMVGASGGPKWLMLCRLDQYLSEHFLSQAEQPIHLIGSSIGSWRMACYAQPDPAAAFRKFESLYTNQRYQELTPQAITDYIDEVLDALFCDEIDQAIVDNPKRILHVVAARNRRLFNSAHPLVQGISIALAATLNLLTKQAVPQLYPRVVVSQAGVVAPYAGAKQTVALTVANLKQALVASGAIPLVLAPSAIEGAKDRLHWDGGIVDYHFSGPFHVDDGLVFYPHFFPKVVPGWFDKALPWRKPKPKDFDNVVMLTPSSEFIASLPMGKIPDRTDFEKLSDVEREQYWQTVLTRTQELIDDFASNMAKDLGRSWVQPIDALF